VADLFYRHVRLTLLAIGLVLVAGLSALQALPRQEDPALSRRFAEIVTFYPGATAARVESLVSEPIEAELQKLHEIRNIESFSRTGSSVVVVELEEEYDESTVDEVWSRVRDKLADVAARLPEGAAVPDFEDKTTTAATILVGFSWRDASEPDLGTMTRLARELETRLRVLPGTRETELFGDADEEVRVTIDALRLAELGLDAGRVARSIASADTRRPSGQLFEAGSTIPFEVEGELDDVDRIRRVPLRVAADGRALRVGDVARVERDVREPPARIALLGGRRSVALSATMQPGSGRVDLWTASARRIVDSFASEVPASIDYHVVFEQNRYTSERLATLAGNLALGAFLVVLVLFAMMGVRAACIVATALPLTLLLVLAELNAFGVPLHQTSVTGLILALGLLIDNAIVAVDEYELRVRRGASTPAAIRQVVHDLFLPLAASTLTTVIAFLPVLLMPGPGGEFVGPIATGVILSVTTSFALSMTVVLAFAGWFLPAERERARAASAEASTSGLRRLWLHGYSNERLTRRYRATIVAVLERPLRGVAVSLVLPVLGFVVGTTLRQQFFPQVDRDQFQVQIEMPAQSSIEATLAATGRARAVIESQPDVIGTDFFVGQAAPRVFYNMLGNQSVPYYAGGFVTTTSAKATERVVPRVQRALEEALPEAVAIALPFEQGPPFAAPIEVRVYGGDLDTLRTIGDELRSILSETDHVTFTRARIEGGRPKLLLHADEDALELAGLRLADVADQLDAALAGAPAGRILEANEEVPIRVRVGGADRSSLARIAATRLQSTRAPQPMPARDGLAGVPVAAVAKFELEPELAAIMRRNGERVNAIHAFLEPFTLIQDSLDDFRARVATSGFELPVGYRIEYGGESEQRGEAVSRLATFALPLFVVMAGAIILTFNSFRMASIIFAVAFLSVGLNARRLDLRLPDGLRRHRGHDGSRRPRHQRFDRDADGVAHRPARAARRAGGDRGSRARGHPPHSGHVAHDDRRLHAADPLRRPLLAADGDGDRRRRRRRLDSRALLRALALRGDATRQRARTRSSAAGFEPRCRRLTRGDRPAVARRRSGDRGLGDPAQLLALFSPLNRRRKVRGTFSMPSWMSTRKAMRPSSTQRVSSSSASRARAR